MATYHIGTIDEHYNPNVFTNEYLGEYEGFWTYIYMGYSRFEMKVSYFIGFPDVTRDGVMDPVLHFAPNYLSLHLGADGLSKNFLGKMKFIKLRVGMGAYVDTS